MDGIATYLVAALALIGAGCAATVLSVYLYPLSIRMRGQDHGRFAGLSSPYGVDPAQPEIKGHIMQNPVAAEQICT
jgi:hypothetical protein